MTTAAAIARITPPSELKSLSELKIPLLSTRPLNNFLNFFLSIYTIALRRAQRNNCQVLVS